MALLVGIVPPASASAHDPLPAISSSNPYDQAHDCVDTSVTGTPVPPPDIGAGAFQILVVGGVTTAFGAKVQGALVAHHVSPILKKGLGSNPLNFPNRIPIYLTKSYFDTNHTPGIYDPTCANPAVAGIVLATNFPYLRVLATAAHELFHAYSSGLSLSYARNWWEEASAVFAEAAVDFGEDPLADAALQDPGVALDVGSPSIHPLAMSRFIEFLDDRQLVGSADGTWPLEREVIGGYPDPSTDPELANRQISQTLADSLATRGTSLGEQLAAFWGDRLLPHPAHGPRLVPTAQNSFPETVSPGDDAATPSSLPLTTVLLDYTLDPSVKWVQFDFEIPSDGYVYGLVDPTTSEQFKDGDSVSFCVGGQDDNDLTWPGHFPVTFTNGSLSGDAITATITVHASTQAEQCIDPLANRACRLLHGAHVESVIPNGTFAFPSAGRNTWSCGYGRTDERKEVQEDVSLRILRFPSSKTARALVRRLLKADVPRIRAGDLAAGRVVKDGTVAILMAVGRETFTFGTYAAKGQHGPTLAAMIQLARGVAREL